METKLKLNQEYTLKKAPKGLANVIGRVGKVVDIVRETNHRAYEMNFNGLIVGFSQAELRVKTFILERAIKSQDAGII